LERRAAEPDTGADVRQRHVHDVVVQGDYELGCGLRLTSR
jgi:hypothetical protein